MDKPFRPLCNFLQDLARNGLMLQYHRGLAVLRIVSSLFRNPKGTEMAVMYERIKAKDYYGSHATGWVVLSNGYPVLHTDCKKEAQNFIDSKQGSTAS